jgi:hypothetical protein
MLRHPIGEQILIDLFVPPAATCFGWVMLRRWVIKVHGDDASEAMRNKNWIFLIILAGEYLLMFSATIYGLLAG